MSDQLKQENPAPESTTILFSNPPSQTVCSANSCENGHSWVPTVQFAKCPGCSGPVLVVKMENCPICNEPTKKLNLRTDHVSSGMGVSAMCKGVASRGEIGVIELERQHASQTEQQLSGSVKKEVA